MNSFKINNCLRFIYLALPLIVLSGCCEKVEETAGVEAPQLTPLVEQVELASPVEPIEIDIDFIEIQMIGSDQLGILQLMGIPQRIETRNDPRYGTSKSVCWDYEWGESYHMTGSTGLTIVFNKSAVYRVGLIDSQHSDGDLPEEDFKEMVTTAIRSEVISKLGMPQIISEKREGMKYFYEINVVRGNTRYKGVTVNFEGEKYNGYSFLLKGKEQVSDLQE